MVRGPPSTRRGNLAEDFGFTDKPENDNGSSLAPALMFNHQPQLYHDVRPGLDVLIGGESLDSASAGLAAMQGKDPMRAKLALAQTLEPLAPEYDMVLIDCPPGDEMLQTNAVAAAQAQPSAWRERRVSVRHENLPGSE